ncbi:hypothetical protein BU24DRAFT_36404 [Aaosphaeria arxii CBS 175.79]|uniref:NTF2-domain-containing protein n=1 Tax=Aaosphaeria arxii CBS 175.79 TaxID=1450172 RepID=A0A6A5Y9W7_9PLEO|nr:uncharacterized protein BU24DRAFT_36404 [Aaosphaeria arxii CBS 175.79]KAF2022046.1 hypothetical protein BU24DRAFT_36404 [Aaosphaeria arxii CBS 175.79]
MASTDSAAPINGNYAHQNFDAAPNNYAAANSNNSAGYNAAQQAPSSGASTSEIPKEEVAWYFVEQYYTTLSKSPDRLYLFYNKRSQFVSGTEEDKVQVCIGQKPINDRIKELDYQDTKVRVTNVDSQSSDANIVIQVIGEISNKGQPHKRFVQTFVLAEQTNGYFVLNDIFRYLAEEPEEEEEQVQQESAGIQEPAPTTTVSQGEQPTGGEEVARSEEDLTKVDHKLEEAANADAGKEASAPSAAVNGTETPETEEVAQAEDAPAAAVVAAVEEPAAKEPEVPAVEEALEQEKPKDPAPTPAPAPAKAAATPAAPPKPAAPRTWASLAASAHKVATPAVPAVAMPQASAPKGVASAPAQPLAVPAQQSAPAREPSPANSQGEATGWQTATGHKKEQSRVQNQPAASDAENKRAYIKNVYSQVEDESLKQAMSKFGEVVYIDISRQKNCAFVDFKTPAAFQAAVNANPHSVNGLELKVEERRLRPSNFAPYPRGGAPRGRGGVGNQGARGGFQPRGGRGGSVRGGRAAGTNAAQDA